VRTVLVFGTFDVVHPGHIYFLQQARMRGDRLAASVARDRFVARFKGKPPVHAEDERLRHVLDTGLVDEAFLSDEEPGTYSAVRRLRPQVICLGHDQDALGENLAAWMREEGVEATVETIDALEPGRYKSSILNAGRRRG
jgi:FAD synthetase